MLFLSLGCQTTRPLPSVDFQEPGWQVRRGQALWQPNESAPELAGDFLLARHSDGRVMAQFLKIPFPSVTAWRESGRWQIEFQPQNRRYAGRGNPPARLLFCHVADAVAGQSLPSSLSVESSPATPNQLRLRQRDSGEALTITWLP